jgi:hypothetical protein
MPPRKRRGRAKKASGGDRGSKKPAFEEFREEGKFTKYNLLI